MTTHTPQITGVLPALLVPVTANGATDTGLLKQQARYLLDAGAHGIFVNGSTAESPFMSIDEKVEVVRAVQEVVQRRIPLYVACIQPSTRQVLQEMEAMAPLEPEFLVATTPFYFGITQEAILEHYRTLAAASPRPLLAYDIPSCTHNKITAPTMAVLPEIPNLVGIKDSSGDLEKFTRGIHGAPEGTFAWIQGSDYLDGASLLSGAAAMVTGTGNVDLSPYVEIWNAAVQGDISGVWKAQKRINHLCQVFERAEGNVIPAIKSAVTFLGRCTHHTRLASMAVPQRYHPAIREVLQEAGLL